MSMTTEQISQDLMTFLREEFPGQGNELTEEMNLLDDWFLDSLSIVDVVMFLESHFDIAVDRKDIIRRQLPQRGGADPLRRAADQRLRGSHDRPAGQPQDQ